MIHHTSSEHIHVVFDSPSTCPLYFPSLNPPPPSLSLLLTTFTELREQTTGWISSAQDTLTDLKDSASDAFSSFKAQAASIEIPTVERPAFFDRIKSTVNEIFTSRTSEETGEEGHRAEGPPEGGDGKDAAGVAALIAATMASPVEPDKEEKVSTPRGGNDEGLMNLTRKLIGIRSILLSIDQGYAHLPLTYDLRIIPLDCLLIRVDSDRLKLPSIIVIGSQSSGKSSVLEAIVGKEFLPK